jgi:hypothetical protein
MIVRINQLDLPRAEMEGGWPEQGMLGPIRYAWPQETHIYEVLILDRDESKQPVDAEFRRQQLRQLVPEAVEALREPGEEIVVRLDGPLTEGELLAAMRHLTDAQGRGRYAFSPLRKLEPDPEEEIGSVRLQMSPAMLAALCADPALGLHRSVRLRAFAVPETLVNPLLDVDTTDDERWGEILSQCGFMLSTTFGLRSLHVRSRRLEPSAMKSRLTKQLMHTAS